MPKSTLAELAKKSTGSLTRPGMKTWESSIVREINTPDKKSINNLTFGKTKLAK
jgi:hypothetical protein